MKIFRTIFLFVSTAIPVIAIAGLYTGPGGSTGPQYIGATGGSGGTATIRQSANCAALTDGITGEQCLDTVLNSVLVCESGPCNATPWVSYSGASSGGVVTTVTGDTGTPTTGADVKVVGGTLVKSTAVSATDVRVDLTANPSACDVLIDFDTYANNSAATAQAFDDIQEAINEWSDWQDDDGDLKNDAKTICTTGEVTITTSLEANARYAKDGAAPANARAAGFSDFISLVPSNPAFSAACGIRGSGLVGTPVACNETRQVETSNRLTFDFGSTVFLIDRSAWPASPTSVLIHIGDQYAAGTNAGNADMYTIKGNPTVRYIGDGDGAVGGVTAPSLNPVITLEQSTTTLLSNTRAIVTMFFDGASNVIDDDFNINIIGSTDTTNIAKDSATVGIWAKDGYTNFSGGNYNSYGLGLAFLEHGPINVKKAIQGSMRGSHIGFQFGDAEWGCDIVFSSVNAAGAGASTPMDCSGFVFHGTYEGTQSLVYGHLGKITFLDSYAEPRTSGPFFHQWLLAAGKDSGSGVLCSSDAQAAANCDTPFEPNGSAGNDANAYGNIVFSGGGIASEYDLTTGTITDDKYSLAVGNAPNNLVIKFSNDFGGGRNTITTSASVYAPWACIGDSGCSGVQFVRGDIFEESTQDGATDPAFTGESIIIPRQYVGTNSDNWVDSRESQPRHGDLAIITADGFTNPQLKVCLDKTGGSCNASQWQPLSGAGDLLANGTVPMTAEFRADALGIEFEAGDAITTCASFPATGGGIFYDDSDNQFKKCENNVLTVLDTGGAGSGDNISVDAGAVVDPNFASSGDVDFVNTSNTVTANINAAVLVNADMADNALDADKIIGDITPDADLDVAAGGTGVSTFSSNAVLLGNGTGDIASSVVTIVAGAVDGITTLEVDGAITGPSFTADPTTTPQVLLQDSSNGGEVSIEMTDSAGPNGVMILKVDVANTLTPYMEIDGITGRIDFLKPLTLIEEATPTTDASGELSIDTDGFLGSDGTDHDAIEFFDGTGSVYLVGTVASSVPTNGQVPKWNTAGTITWQDDNSAGSPTWDTLGDAGGLGSVGFAGFDQDIVSAEDGGDILTIANTDADNAADTTILRLAANDTADANTIFIQTTLDEAGTPVDTFHVASTANATESVIKLGSDGVLITGNADGDLTITGNGTGSDESLTFNFDDTANTVAVSSGSGVTLTDWGSLGFLTSGTIRGNIDVNVTTTGTDSPSCAELRGTMHIADNATATADVDYTLPEISTCGTGASVCFYDNGGGTGGIIIDAAAGDEILLAGTGVGVADAIDSPGVAGDGANGDFVCLLAIDSAFWVTLGQSGTWVDGGVD